MENTSLCAASLLKIISDFPSLRKGRLFQRVSGISVRDLNALVGKDPAATLTLEQSLPVLRVLEILSLAVKVMGSKAATDSWISGKTTRLGNKVPLEMMLTPEGQLALREYLVRMDYCVYC
jgi:putative toxin-antitoxin system antitoxin component (TIGR02293 family)